MLHLSDNIKSQIRDIHKRIGANLPNYQPRKQQNYLVAEIAKTLGGEYHRSNRICVIEAGTGTGKSLAYCLGALVMAKEHDLKVVISTATVALQEQLMDKDLPFLPKSQKWILALTLSKVASAIAAHKNWQCLAAKAQMSKTINNYYSRHLIKMSKNYLASFIKPIIPIAGMAIETHGLV